jgi:hypothetical protein
MSPTNRQVNTNTHKLVDNRCKKAFRGVVRPGRANNQKTTKKEAENKHNHSDCTLSSSIFAFPI